LRDAILGNAAQDGAATAAAIADIAHSLPHVADCVNQPGFLSFFQESLTFLEEHYDCEKFLPGELGRLNDRLGMARNNFEHEQFQATLPMAQEGYLKTREAMLRLELMEAEWEAVYDMVWAECEALKAALDNNRTLEITMKDDEGREIQETLDVEFCSRGTLGELRSNIDVMAREIAQPSRLTKERLLELSTELHEGVARGEKIVHGAAAAYHAYINGMDIQEIVAKRLQEKGFFVEDNLFEGDDKREANVLILANSTGEKILTRVHREPGSEHTSFLLELNSDDEKTRDSRLEAVLNALQLEMTLPKEKISVKPRAGFEHKAAPAESFDVERYRKKQKRS